MISKKIIIFDLDRTLAESKCALSKDMATALEKLLESHFVCIISGWDFPQFEKQVLSYMKNWVEKLILAPTSWWKMYQFMNGLWEKIYSLDFTDDEKKKIIETLDWAIDALQLRPKQIWGAILEDRWTQIACSFLWQSAPVEVKEVWDPNLEKRKKIQAYVKDSLSEFSVNIGGSSTIDVTRKWVDKWFWVSKLQEMYWFLIPDMLFIWDAIYPWWNDYPPYKIWVESIKTESPSMTYDLIQKIMDWRESEIVRYTDN